jgi:biotin transport system substrate-specific component
MTANIGTSALVVSLLPTDRIARIAGQIALVVLGSAVIALSAKVKVPMWPVDMTLQTLAILVIAGLYGRTLAVLTLAAYLAEGALGFPVFQGTPERGIGLAYMVGPTAGYLAGFLVMAWIVGEAVDRGWGSRPLPLFGALLAGELAVLVLGAAWLSVLFGPEVGLVSGFGVFVIPDLMKVALATCIVTAASRLR